MLEAGGRINTCFLDPDVLTAALLAQISGFIVALQGALGGGSPQDAGAALKKLKDYGILLHKGRPVDPEIAHGMAQAWSEISELAVAWATESADLPKTKRKPAGGSGCGCGGN